MVTTPWASEEPPHGTGGEFGTQRSWRITGPSAWSSRRTARSPISRARITARRKPAPLRYAEDGKPFVVVVNTQTEKGTGVDAIRASYPAEYGVQALTMDWCGDADVQDIARLLEAVVYAFPVEELRFFSCRAARALPDDHPVKAALHDAMALDRASCSRALKRGGKRHGSLRSLIRSTRSACGRSIRNWHGHLRAASAGDAVL